MKTTTDEILTAKDALVQSGIVRNGEYSSVFGGYISSFGASLVQAGLLPTIIFFEGDSEAKDRPLVIKALKKMMNLPDNTKMSEYILIKEQGESLRRCDSPAFISRVVRCMTAMKLALRMYNKIKVKD